MTSRQRGPPHSNARPPNGQGTTVWGRRGSGDEWEALYIDSSHGSDRDHYGLRESLREGRQDAGELPSHNPYYRPRRESNASLHNDLGGRQPRQRQPISSVSEEARVRVTPSPNRMYKEDGRPRSDHLNPSHAPRDRYY